MFKGRETAAATPGTIRKLDYEVGDIVQIQATSKNNVGRLGVIIGIRYKKLNTGDALLYSVKFSDNDGADFLADHMKFIRHADDGEI